MNIQPDRSCIVPGHFPLPPTTEELVVALKREISDALPHKERSLALFNKLRENKLQPDIGLALNPLTQHELETGTDIAKIASLLADPIIVFVLSTWETPPLARGVVATKSGDALERKLDDYKRSFMLTLLTTMQVGRFSQFGYLGAQQPQTAKILSSINDQNVEPVSQSVIRLALDLWGKAEEARWQNHMNAFVEFFAGDEKLLQQFAEEVSAKICKSDRNAIANFSDSGSSSHALTNPSSEGRRWRAKMGRLATRVSGLLVSPAVPPMIETPSSNSISVKAKKMAGQLLQYTPTEGYFCKTDHRRLGYSHAALILDGITKLTQETEPDGMEESVAWAHGILQKTFTAK